MPRGRIEARCCLVRFLGVYLGATLIASSPGLIASSHVVLIAIGHWTGIRPGPPEEEQSGQCPSENGPVIA